jgi:hypothetical protein
MRGVERNVLEVIARHGIIDGETLDRHFYEGNSDQRNYRMRQLAVDQLVVDFRLDAKRKYWVLGKSGEAACGVKRRGRTRDFAGEELKKRYGMVRFCFDREEPFVLLRNDELEAEFADITEGIEGVRCHYFFEVKDGKPNRLGHLLVDTLNPEDQLLKRVGEAVRKRSGNEKFRELVRARAFYCVIVTGDEKKALALASAAKERQAKHGLSVAVETHVVPDLFDLS